MKYLFIIILLPLLILSQSSKMSKIKKAVKDKVEKKRSEENENQIQLTDGNNSKINVEAGSFTEADFKRSYEFQPNDDIPWNAIIYVYDGRYEDEPFNPDRNIESYESKRGNFYAEYPYSGSRFYNVLEGKDFFSRFNYTYGYGSEDQVSLNDYVFFFAFDHGSLRVNYKILSNEYGDEAIDFTFLTASPGVFIPIRSMRTGFNLYAGFASFSIKSDFSQTFGGVNVGLESLSMLGYNMSLQLKIEHIAVKDRSSDTDYFINFFLAEADLGYHYDRFKFSLGYQLQKFNDLGLQGDDRFLRQTNFGIHVFY
jgi:hypothetical protein